MYLSIIIIVYRVFASRIRTVARLWYRRRLDLKCADAKAGHRRVIKLKLISTCRLNFQ